ncbi:hypothetical protein G4B88_030095 [Cannabis sativa]|uniref:Rho-GAP domain-containing protein n=1 Tax=Cannabis sativa TaxID=3483 RepID=A0A7J6DWP5_CANSA|nr:hypothetical protein G4B88_030095 [Cannabis sativa]
MSASVFGVSTESMQCCYDSRGNNVPTILLLMHECLYSQGGLKPTETALLNWAVDLMTVAVEEEEYNKMNARNIVMVFSPNMTQVW